jgi:hypothetical protein
MRLPAVLHRGRVLDALDAIRFSLEGATAPVPMGLHELRMAIAQGRYDLPAPTVRDIAVEDLVDALRGREGIEVYDCPEGAEVRVYVARQDRGPKRWTESQVLGPVAGGVVLRVFVPEAEV